MVLSIDEGVKVTVEASPLPPADQAGRFNMPFVFQGELFSTFKNFASAIKFPEGDPRRLDCSRASDPKAVIAELVRRQKTDDLPEFGSVIYISGKIYRARGEEHQQLMREAEAAYKASYSLPQERYRTVNVVSSSTRAGLLSNFSPISFRLDGDAFASVEAFIQAIKCPEDDPRRVVIAKLSGKEAKFAGHALTREIAENYKTGKQSFVYWQGEAVPYRSEAHFALIERAIRAKIEASPEVRAQLLATGTAHLIHNTGRRESAYTSLPADKFCEILMRIRDTLY